MNDSQATAAFAALGNPVRFAIWRVLLSYGSQGAAAGMLGARVQALPSALSFHLKTMMAAGLVCQRRQHRNHFYAVEPDMATMLSRMLLSPEPASAPLAEVASEDAATFVPLGPDAAASGRGCF